MIIQYLGHACFKLTANSGKTVITDPYTQVGYELSNNLTADIVTVSHGHFDHNATALVKAKTVINGVGRYEDNEISVFGIPTFHDDKKGALRGENIVYKIQMDGLTVCHFGDLGEPCNTRLIEEIGEVDVLLIPIGGRYTINATEAKKYVDLLNPSVVVPMHYKTPDGTIDIADEKEFLSFFESVQYAGEKSVTITKELLAEQKIIFMERKRQ